MLRFSAASQPSILHYSHLIPPRRSPSIISHSSRGGIRLSPYRSPSSPSPSSSSSFTTTKLLTKQQKSRILTRLNTRLPKFLHPYTNPLLSAPLSHITSFFILHEFTALVPFVALFGAFHYTHWLPDGFYRAAWAREKAEKLLRYLKTKSYWRRWLQKQKVEEEEEEGESESNSSSTGRMGERISRILLEYVISLRILFIFFFLLFFPPVLYYPHPLLLHTK